MAQKQANNNAGQGDLIMEIRHSTEADFDRIMKIYEYARKFMADNGNPNQWGPTNWPPEQLIHNDIACGKGLLRLIKVKPEGKGEMFAKDWYNGVKK